MSAQKRERVSETCWFEDLDQPVRYWPVAVEYTETRIVLVEADSHADAVKSVDWDYLGDVWEDADRTDWSDLRVCEGRAQFGPVESWRNGHTVGPREACAWCGAVATEAAPGSLRYARHTGDCPNHIHHVRVIPVWSHVAGHETVLIAAHTWHVPPGQVWAAGAVAAVTGGGALSPDVDNQRWFRRLDRSVPDEWLGNGGPLQHRGLLHWWGWPALLAAFLTWGPASPTVAEWAAWGVVAGWASHLLGDFLQGAQNPMYGLRAGIPLAPWWWHAGTGIGCSSLTARAMNGAVYLATAWAAFTLATGHPLVPSQSVLEALR